MFRKIIAYIISVHFTLFIVNCGSNLDPDPLPLNVRQNLAYLQAEPQFVMYFNFRKMRDTGFWKSFITDSVFNAERNFGSFLGLLKQAGGVSISNGIDELYFSNTWLGENALLVKGVFDRKKVDDYIEQDSLFSKISYPNKTIVYRHNESNFNFYFKDDFTLCGSNYLKQIENTFSLTDTSQTGLLTNFQTMKDIERIKYKENLWMISTQKLFIRGIFENFADMNKSGQKNLPGGERDSLMLKEDTTGSEESLYDIYKKINSLSFSMKMTDALEIVMQNECEDEISAGELKNRAEAIIALAKLSSAFSKKKPTEVIKLLDKIETEVYTKTVLLNIKLSENEIAEIRKQKIF